jgi:hypothetical protein
MPGLALEWKAPRNSIRRVMDSFTSLTPIEKDFLTALAANKTYSPRGRLFTREWKKLIALGLATRTPGDSNEIYAITPAGAAAARESDPRFLPDGRRHAIAAPGR